MNNYDQGGSFGPGYQQFYPRFGRNILGQDIFDLRLRVDGQVLHWIYCVSDPVASDKSEAGLRV